MAKKKNCRACHGIGGFWMNFDDALMDIHIHEWQPCTLCGGR